GERGYGGGLSGTVYAQPQEHVRPFTRGQLQRTGNILGRAMEIPPWRLAAGLPVFQLVTLQLASQGLDDFRSGRYPHVRHQQGGFDLFQQIGIDLLANGEQIRQAAGQAGAGLAQAFLDAFEHAELRLWLWLWLWL